MATTTKSGVSFYINQNTTSTTATLLSNQSTGITVTSVKVEADGGGYLSPNSSGRTFKLTISGSTSGSKELWSYTAGTTGAAFPYNTFSGGSTLLKGNINIVFSASGSINWGPQGYVNPGTYKITLTYEPYWTNCTAPTSVSVSRSRGVCTVSWSGMSGGTNNAITKYGVLVNTSASTSGATTVNAGATGTSLTSSPGTNKTVYFGVCSISAHNTTGYKWSGAVSIPAKPSVSAGTVITDTQMDNLRTWINTSGITDIGDGGIVYASHGNTYRSGLTAGSSKVEASWYNTAAG